MTQLSSDQLQDAKRELQESVRELLEYRKKKDADISDEEFEEISERIRDILNDSARLTLSSISGTANEIADSVKNIQISTNNANASLRTIVDIKKALRIAAAIAGLAASLAAGNPAGIINSLADGLNEIANT